MIGHGRSPEGRGWGPEIDACGLVVRMWDCHWQPAQDYGTRYDFGMVALNHGQIAAWMKFNERSPARGWLGFLREGTMARPGFETVDPANWNRMARLLGARRQGGRFNLTRGCAALCWAIERAGKGGEVVAVGFDNLRRGWLLPVDEAFPADYLAHYDRAFPGWRGGYGYQSGADTCGSHDIAVERWLVGTLADSRGVTVHPAGDLWGA